MQNPDSTLLAQYANSPTISGLVEAMNQWLDPSADLESFRSMIWDVSTAQGYGLDVWGKIVGVSRLLTVVNTQSTFGFKEQYLSTSPTNPNTFGFAPFYAGVTTGTYSLPDASFRTLIYVKALANITNCTAPSLNRLLSLLFASRGAVFVQDSGGMQISLVCNFTLSPVDLSILASAAVPRPAGVLVSIVQGALTSDFGFVEGGGQPFGQGPLFNH
ncbi:MAG: DUF2612 domain-containing protein [Rhodospirillales bacterium]|nr:DUF2612 domain-containing protein [Rhodospirillales bacterium]